MLKNLRENRKKGFTLVELIVVLVILAILAALLIPALTGYIDKAKEKQIIAETRQVVMASQTLVDEEYGKLALGDGSAITVGSTGTVTFADVAALAEVSESNILNVTVASRRITNVTYRRGGKTCKYTWDATAKTGSYEVN